MTATSCAYIFKLARECSAPRPAPLRKEMAHDKDAGPRCGIDSKGESDNQSAGSLVAARYSAAGVHLMQISPGVDRRIVQAHFKVDMGSRRVSAFAFITNHVAALHRRSRLQGVRRKVRVPGCQTETVINNNDAPVALPFAREYYDAVPGRANVISVM